MITLEPANEDNVELLIKWTLDPVAQGPYKRVPAMTADELRDLFLHSPDRHYFMIKRTADQKPLGRFYYRAWRFQPGSKEIDWELNIFIADPAERGRGYGTAVQVLATEFLLQLPETRSRGEAGRRVVGFAPIPSIRPASPLLMPSPYYQVKLPPEACILYVRRKEVFCD